MAGVIPTSTGSDWGKAHFESIYNCPDPHRYFATLHPLEYQIPHHGQMVFRALADALRQRRGTPAPLRVVDLCCSYGVNAALLNHQVSLDDLYHHYSASGTQALEGEELARADLAYYAARRRPDAAHVTGLDAADRAVAYGVAAGLLDQGFAENLEIDAPSAQLRQALSGTDLITVTGGVGYITARTFSRLFDSFNEPPWVAAMVLRTVSYRPISALLARAGLVTERLTTRTFRQRRFADDAERQGAFEALAARGLSVGGKEAHGFYHAELYVSRPAADVAALPLAELLPAF
ncbi:hypothetical protein [Streptomyces sp. NPDC093097]|uniref:hypothetical protein n=1 Tax=Streptomyces sp. NPDC093097 TaxID=3366027 RepID=UPI00382CAE74